MSSIGGCVSLTKSVIVSVAYSSPSISRFFISKVFSAEGIAESSKYIALIFLSSCIHEAIFPCESFVTASDRKASGGDWLRYNCRSVEAVPASTTVSFSGENETCCDVFCWLTESFISKVNSAKPSLNLLHSNN